MLRSVDLCPCFRYEMFSRFQLRRLRRFNDNSQARRVAWLGKTTLLFHLLRKYGRLLGKRKCVSNAFSCKSAKKRAVQVPQKNVRAIDYRINSLGGVGARLRPVMPADPYWLCKQLTCAEEDAS